MGRKPLGMEPAELITVRVQKEIILRINDYAKARGIERADAIRELLERGLRSFDRAQKRQK